MKSNQRQQILAHDHQTKSLSLSACLLRSGLSAGILDDLRERVSPSFVSGSKGAGGLWLVAPTHLFLLYDSTPTPFHHPSNKVQPGLDLASVTQDILLRL